MSQSMLSDHNQHEHDNDNQNRNQNQHEHEHERHENNSPHEHPNDQHHSTTARKIAFTKGILDILLSLSLFFLPSLFYDGFLTAGVYKLTGIPAAPWALDPAGLASLAALIMGCGFAGITAGQSESDDAYRTVAALSGASSLTSLLTTLLSPYKHASSFLLLHAVYNAAWFGALVRGGGFGVMDCVGMSERGLCVVEEWLARDVVVGRGRAREAGGASERGMQVQGGKDETEGMQGTHEKMHERNEKNERMQGSGGYEKRGARVVQ